MGSSLTLVENSKIVLSGKGSVSDVGDSGDFLCDDSIYWICESDLRA